MGFLCQSFYQCFYLIKVILESQGWRKRERGEEKERERLCNETGTDKER